MRLNADAINGYRAVVKWILRAIALLLLVLGAYLVLKRMVFGVGAADFHVVMRSYTELGESNSLYRGLAMLAVGGLLAALAGRLSRWIVEVPATGCPRCGYGRSVKTPQATCPECGLEF